MFKHVWNKEKAAEDIRALTYDRQIWKDSIVGGKNGHPDSMPPYKAIYADWNVNTPDWAPSCASLARGRLDKAKPIDNERFGLQQFLIGEPIWGSDLTGKDAKPKVAIQKVWMPEA